MTSGDVALFVDWENLQLPTGAGKAEHLTNLVQPYGRLVLARAYADWAQRPNGSAEQFTLYSAGIEPVYVPCKNADGGTVRTAST